MSLLIANDVFDFIHRNHPEIATWVLVFASIALALVTFFQLREARKMREHVEAMEAARELDRQHDRKKALLVATCRKTDDFHWQIILRNRGQGSAHSIALTLDGDPAEENWSPTSVVPLNILGPNAHFIYWMRKANTNEPYPSLVALKWQDDSGEAGEFVTTLNLTRR